MNTAVVSALIAKLTAGCGLVLLLPLLTALFGEEPVLPFIYSMALCFLLSAFLRYKGKKKVINLNPRDGLAVTALSWICRRPGNHRHLCGSLPAGRKRKRPHD